MARHTERFKAWKDKLQNNRNTIAYLFLLLGLIGTAMGWGLLPDLVSMDPTMEDAYFQPKERLLAVHMGMTTLFTGLFWKWPRELAYFVGAFISLCLVYVLLGVNLGV